jgi:hypothetical protein
MNAGTGFATVYVTAAEVVVASHSYLGMGAGGLALNGSTCTAARDIDDAALGRLVIEAVHMSRHEVPMPDFHYSYPPFVDPLKTVGVKTLRALQRTTAQVQVELVDGIFHVTPLGWTGKQLIRLDTARVALADGDTAQFGRAVRDAAEV